MIKLTDRMPAFGEGKRVLIYTEGTDFNGEQFFDVQADLLYESFYAEGDDRPEIYDAATRWMDLPYPWVGQ